MEAGVAGCWSVSGECPKLPAKVVWFTGGWSDAAGEQTAIEPSASVLWSVLVAPAWLLVWQCWRLPFRCSGRALRPKLGGILTPGCLPTAFPLSTARR